MTTPHLYFSIHLKFFFNSAKSIFIASPKTRIVNKLFLSGFYSHSYNRALCDVKKSPSLGIYRFYRLHTE